MYVVSYLVACIFFFQDTVFAVRKFWKMFVTPVQYLFGIPCGLKLCRHLCTVTVLQVYRMGPWILLDTFVITGAFLCSSFYYSIMFHWNQVPVVLTLCGQGYMPAVLGPNTEVPQFQLPLRSRLGYEKWKTQCGGFLCVVVLYVNTWRLWRQTSFILLLKSFDSNKIHFLYVLM